MFGKVVSLLIGSSYALMHNQVHIQNLLDMRTHWWKPTMHCTKVPQPSPELVGMPTFLVVEKFLLKNQWFWLFRKKWVQKIANTCTLLFSAIGVHLTKHIFSSTIHGAFKTTKCMLQWAFYFLKFVEFFFPYNNAH